MLYIHTFPLLSYDLMLNCWKLDREERPSFYDLQATIESQLYELYPYMMFEIPEAGEDST